MKAKYQVGWFIGYGKFMWTPALNLLEWIPEGQRSSQLDWQLNVNQNDIDGIYRKVGRIVASGFLTVEELEDAG